MSKPDDDKPVDVAVLGNPTDDGEGRRVLRIRDGAAAIGEVRPLRHGRALAPNAEIVTLAPREGQPNVCDVEVAHRVEAPAAPRAAGDGPAQVATEAYRESWDRIFGGHTPRGLPS